LPEVVALLRECKNRPDDLTSFLVLADWLDEHGQDAERAMAALIRHDCSLDEPLPHPSENETRDQLLRSHRDSWLPEGPVPRDCRIGRGLLRVGYTVQDGPQLAPPGPTLPGGWEWVERLKLAGIKSGNVHYALDAAPLQSVSRLSLSYSNL